MIKKAVLKSAQFESPLGEMIAVADEQTLYLLEFLDARGVAREMEKLCSKTKLQIMSGETNPIKTIKKELKDYFNGDLKTFKTPIHLLGSAFQKTVWSALMCIPYGETRSYAEQAIVIQKPTAYRAVANANGANQLAIIIPCHRIIHHNGTLGGYGGGVKRKEWLLQHEQKFRLSSTSTLLLE